MSRFSQTLGWPEKALLLLIVCDIALSFFPSAGLAAAVLTSICWILGVIVLIRLVRRNLKPALWRLRNRLIVSYLFIAVVPMALLLALGGIAGYVLFGQMATYTVISELRQKLVRGVAPSPELFSDLATNFGDLLLVEWTGGSNRDPSFRDLRRHHIPPPVNFLDIELDWYSPITYQSKSYGLVIRSRPSAVLGTIFGQRMDWAGDVLLGAILVGSLFLIVQLTSIFVGVSITRTITRAVNDLYQGTERIKEGDFSHRIAVRGSDQLGELSQSFNVMTENLERLIAVEKEKERLHSELEIAREVQRRLFPKSALVIPSLSLMGVCYPAHMVSGDYYDFLRLGPSSLAMALGDVAGKGISAALLMATIQAAMRSQLAGPGPISTAEIVASLNRQIYSSTAPEKYATFFFAVYDEAAATLAYTNAGHLPPILIRCGTAQRLEVTGTVVGAFPTAQYEERRIALERGDLFLAYTDGLTEPENAYGEMFGDQRLIDVLIKHQTAAGAEIVERAIEAVREWTGSPELQDDMTMLIARRAET